MRAAILLLCIATAVRCELEQDSALNHHVEIVPVGKNQTENGTLIQQNQFDETLISGEEGVASSLRTFQNDMDGGLVDGDAGVAESLSSIEGIEEVEAVEGC